MTIVLPLGFLAAKISRRCSGIGLLLTQVTITQKYWEEVTYYTVLIVIMIMDSFSGWLRRAVIGHDTWIGHGAQIRPEVTLGHGSVVAGGAIVTKDMPPYMIVAGIPAFPLRLRFLPDVAARMMVLAWWDWSHDALRAALDDFRALSAEAFLEKYS